MKKYLLIATMMISAPAFAQAPTPQNQPLPTGMQYVQQENSQLGQQLSMKTGQISQLLDEVATIKKKYDDCVVDFDKCKVAVEHDKAEAAKKTPTAPAAPSTPPAPPTAPKK